LLQILEPIKSEIGSGPNHNVLENCRAFITNAIEISGTLNHSAAGLLIIDKPYFEKHGWTYHRGREFYRTKFENEDARSYVELIARPGFVKCGDDNGENFGTFAPWIPAIVQTTQIKQAVPSPPRPIQRES